MDSGELEESPKESKSSSPESSDRRTGSEESDEVAASLSSVGQGVSPQLVHAQFPFGKFYPAFSAAQEVTKQLVRRPEIESINSRVRPPEIKIKLAQVEIKALLIMELDLIIPSTFSFSREKSNK